MNSEHEDYLQKEERVRSGGRFLLYSHDGAGLGHTRRNLAIASAITRRDATAAVLVVTGSQSVCRLGLPPGVDFLKLPGLIKVRNGEYGARHLHIRPDEIVGLRSSIIEAAVRSFRPDVMLVDRHPLGAKRELSSAVRAASQMGVRLVLGLRDILDDPETVHREWHNAGVPEIIDRYYDQILIYGCRTILDPIEEYDLPAGLADRVQYCSYVLHDEAARLRHSDAPPPFMVEPRSQPVVLATVGGGEDGYPLLDAFIDASRDAPWRGVLVTGPLAPSAERRELASRAEVAGIPLYTIVGGLAAWFSLVDAVVAMGGYNTLAELVSTGTPAVCVPRVAPRQEQAIRAEAFARLGLMNVVHPSTLSPQSLAAQISIALRQSRSQLRAEAKRHLDFDGADTAAQALIQNARVRVPARRVG